MLIVVTDGNETKSVATLDETIAAATEAGVSVYVVGIESARFTPEPLQQLAGETGGSYYAAASAEALNGVYQSIAEELRRTWQVRYFTAARPGEALELQAKAGDDVMSAQFKAPGTLAPVDTARERSPLLPATFLHGWWGAFVLALGVALLVLVAAAFAFASPRGAGCASGSSPMWRAASSGRPHRRSANGSHSQRRSSTRRSGRSDT